jgi:hypothetical protein
MATDMPADADDVLPQDFLDLMWIRPIGSVEQEWRRMGIEPGETLKGRWECWLTGYWKPVAEGSQVVKRMPLKVRHGCLKNPMVGSSGQDVMRWNPDEEFDSDG